MKDLREQLSVEIGKVIIGQQHLVDAALVAIATGGHILIEGAPGTAKTLLASALARACGGTFRRVQCTPDLLPSDITGTLTLHGGELAFRPGPIFTNLLLADELNRTPPKTQAALLEAMQEGQVTVDGTARPLPDPFIVIATENPIEYEGTYPLPEAQLDRFLLKLRITYPSAEEEVAMLHLAHTGVSPVGIHDVQPITTPSALIALRHDISRVSVSEAVITYITAVVRRTRELPSVSLGASPRAAVHLLAASRALASMAGRSFVTPDDVAALASPVLAHRLVLQPEAELEHFRPEDAIQAALSSVPVPR
ncbi:MAG: MoxR family ATPase [Actinobacteria bacterium]|jgi:MoxR-like ATPase|nr:MoxR family ATPase [Actinomycetota bacterium]